VTAPGSHRRGGNLARQPLPALTSSPVTICPVVSPPSGCDFVLTVPATRRTNTWLVATRALHESCSNSPQEDPEEDPEDAGKLPPPVSPEEKTRETKATGKTSPPYLVDSPTEHYDPARRLGFHERVPADGMTIEEIEEYQQRCSVFRLFTTSESLILTYEEMIEAQTRFSDRLKFEAARRMCRPTERSKIHCPDARELAIKRGAVAAVGVRRDPFGGVALTLIDGQPITVEPRAKDGHLTRPPPGNPDLRGKALNNIAMAPVRTFGARKTPVDGQPLPAFLSTASGHRMQMIDGQPATVACDYKPSVTEPTIRKTYTRDTNTRNSNAVEIAVGEITNATKDAKPIHPTNVSNRTVAIRPINKLCAPTTSTSKALDLTRPVYPSKRQHLEYLEVLDQMEEEKEKTEEGQDNTFMSAARSACAKAIASGMNTVKAIVTTIIAEIVTAAVAVFGLCLLMLIPGIGPALALSFVYWIYHLRRG
jgi:hypothetical protein